jgi:hypothetical protein
MVKNISDATKRETLLSILLIGVTLINPQPVLADEKLIEDVS